MDLHVGGALLAAAAADVRSPSQTALAPETCCLLPPELQGTPRAKEAGGEGWVVGLRGGE